LQTVPIQLFTVWALSHNPGRALLNFTVFPASNQVIDLGSAALIKYYIWILYQI